MPGKPTIRTVAERAGVSIATVSKVSNQISKGVSEATRGRVEAAIRELAYRPSRVGRGLRTLRRSTVGMAIVDPSPTFLTDPFTTNLVAGLANYLSARGFGLLLHGVQPRRLKSSFLVRESEVDGLCVMLSGSRRARLGYMRLLSDLGQPFVAFQDTPDESIADACFVRQDDRQGAVELARSLLVRRPRRAAIVISAITWPAVEQRVAGFRSVFSEQQIALDMVRCDESNTAAVSAAVAGYLDQAGLPDLIVGQNDQIALAAIQVLRSRGARMPEDVGVSGFNAFPFASFADPPLTTVRSRAYDLGEIGAALLIERFMTGHFSQREHVLPVALIRGGSA